MTIPAPPKSTEESRRRKLLDAAVGVFMRFGFRKTSMDEVARAADVSRQGLYLHFPTKEDLFRAAVQHVFETVQHAVRERLSDKALPLQARLVGAFDERMGRFVGVMGPGASDLAETSNELVGPLVLEHERQFELDLAKALRGAGLVAAYKSVGLSANQLAATLNATARGLKYACETRAEFIERFTHAVRALCMPLRKSRS